MKNVLFFAVVVGLATAAIDSAAQAQGSTGPTYPAATPGAERSGTPPPGAAMPGGSPPSNIPSPSIATSPSPDWNRRPPMPRSGLNSDPHNPSGAPGPGVGLGASPTR